MKRFALRVGMLAAVIVLATNSAWAHNMLADDGSHVDAAHAITVADPAVSQVVYHEVAAQSPVVWLTFHADAQQALHAEVGVPEIARLAAYRPAFALIGPGLPAAELPFAVPEGAGAILVTTDDIVAPEVFYEPFTGTSSWKFPPLDISAPETGDYYLAAFEPSGEPGKLWLAVGTAEAFSLADILSLPRVVLDVRAFHETSAFGGLALGVIALLAALLMLVILRVALAKP